MDNTLRQWTGNKAWELIANLKEKHNAYFELIDFEWFFYKDNEFVKKEQFRKNEPICWQVYHLFFSSLPQ